MQSRVRAGETVVVLVVLLAACSSSSHSGTGSTTLTTAPRLTVSSSTTPSTSPSTTAPSTTTTNPAWVVRPESCGALQYGADGDAGPVTCPDGRPNAAAVAYYANDHLKVTVLPSTASPTDVERAICADLASHRTTNVIEQSAYDLMAAEMDWHFGIDPSNVILNGGCAI